MSLFAGLDQRCNSRIILLPPSSSDQISERRLSRRTHTFCKCYVKSVFLWSHFFPLLFSVCTHSHWSSCLCVAAGHRVDRSGRVQQVQVSVVQVCAVSTCKIHTHTSGKQGPEGLSLPVKHPPFLRLCAASLQNIIASAAPEHVWSLSLLSICADFHVCIW